MTDEILAEEQLHVEGDFDELMDEQRDRGRAGAGAGGGAHDDAIVSELAALGAGAGRARASPAMRPRISARRSKRCVRSARRATATARARAARYLVKLAESPFYAPGGGQIADVGTLECDDGECRAQVENVLRIGNDQALEVVLERGELRAGEQVLARVDHVKRHATEANHTATHLLQAALRERLGSHVRQAGSYVGPDKLRFDFSHGQALSSEELRGGRGARQRVDRA